MGTIIVPPKPADASLFKGFSRFQGFLSIPGPAADHAAARTGEIPTPSPSKFDPATEVITMRYAVRGGQRSAGPAQRGGEFRNACASVFAGATPDRSLRFRLRQGFGGRVGDAAARLPHRNHPRDTFFVCDAAVSQ